MIRYGGKPATIRFAATVAPAKCAFPAESLALFIIGGANDARIYWNEADALADVNYMEAPANTMLPLLPARAQAIWIMSTAGATLEINVFMIV